MNNKMYTHGLACHLPLQWYQYCGCMVSVGRVLSSRVRWGYVLGKQKQKKAMLLCYSWSYWWGMFTGTEHYSLWTISRFIDHKDQNDNSADIAFDQNIMPRLSLLDKARAIGQHEVGIHRNVVAQNFGISQSTVSRLQQKFRETGDVKDRPRSGRPKVTTPAEDRYIRRLALRLGLQGNVAGGCRTTPSEGDSMQRISVPVNLQRSMHWLYCTEQHVYVGVVSIVHGLNKCGEQSCLVTNPDLVWGKLMAGCVYGGDVRNDLPIAA